jgi:hypothetical protein
MLQRKTSDLVAGPCWDPASCLTAVIQTVKDLKHFAFFAIPGLLF